MINILFGGNYKVADGLLISVLSIVKHTDRPLNIKCLTMDLTEKDEMCKPISQSFSDLINKIIKEKNPNSSFTLIDMGQDFKSTLVNSINIKSRFTPYAMLRLLADKVDMPDRYIYLDTDTVINRDLGLLFDYDIGNAELGVVRDAYRISKTYFNSGVMLVNHKACVESKLYERARDIVNHKKLLYVDQTALNMSCKNRVMLPLIFNSKSKYYPEIVVHHFCDVRKHFFHRIKPWEVDLVKEKMHAYDDILDEYLRLKETKAWEY